MANNNTLKNSEKIDDDTEFAKPKVQADDRFSLVTVEYEFDGEQARQIIDQIPITPEASKPKTNKNEQTLDSKKSGCCLS